jgi:hypothetical protein
MMSLKKKSLLLPRRNPLPRQSHLQKKPPTKEESDDELEEEKPASTKKKPAPT